MFSFFDSIRMAFAAISYQLDYAYKQLIYQCMSDVNIVISVSETESIFYHSLTEHVPIAHFASIY